MFKLVRQQHNNGCVPAAIATITGIPYQDALKAVYHAKRPKEWDHHGTKHKDMLRALDRLGLKYRERYYLVPFSQLRSNAIIIVEHSIYGPPGHRSHVVVWDYEQQRILDPYPSPTRHMKRHLPQTSYQKAAQFIIDVK